MNSFQEPKYLKRIKILILLFTHFSFAGKQNGFSQSFQLLGDKCFGGTDEEWYYDGAFHNNKLILFGSSASGISGNKVSPLCNPLLINERDYWMIQLDTSFNIIWQKEIGGDNIDMIGHIILSNDQSRYYICGSSRSDSSCAKSENNKNFPFNHSDDYWIGATDTNGILLWEKTIGGNNSDDCPQICQLSNGELIVIGKSSSPVSGDKTVQNFGLFDWWIVKLDILGNKIWDKVAGGTQQEIANVNKNFILPIENGEFLFGGTTNSPLSGTISDSSRGDYDIVIIKFDNAGNQIWDKRFGGNYYDTLTDLKETSDNGFIFCANTNSDSSGDVSNQSHGIVDYWLVKLDSSGNKIWDKRYGGLNANVCSSIATLPGGGYLVAGVTDSNIGLDVSESGYGLYDFWVLKLDDSGSILWNKKFGGTLSEYYPQVIILPDNSVILVGTADSSMSSVKTDIGYGETDYWIMRFQYQDSTLNQNELEGIESTISVYPNPANSTLTIETGNLKSSHYRLIISDVAGRIVFSNPISGNSTKQEFDISVLLQGIYFVQIEGGERIKRCRFVKE